MIETECYAELNEIYLPTGELVPDLNPDYKPGTAPSKSRANQKAGFFSRLFRRKVGVINAPTI